MAQITIEQFASELKMPAGALLEQLSAAGVDVKKEGDKLTEQDKTRLLDYLRKQHGAAAEPKKRITLTRKQTTEIKAADSTGKARTIQVEVRKKRVLVRREEEAADTRRGAGGRGGRGSAGVRKRWSTAPPVAPPVTPPAAPASLLSEKEIAAREEESRKAQALAKRQTDEQKEKQQRETARKTKKEREAEEAAAKAAAEAAALAAAAKAAEAKPAVDAKAAAADAKAKTEGTLHRPAAKPGEKRERATKKAPGQVFQEEAARRRALKMRGDTGGAGAAPGWRGPKVGGRHRDDEGGDAASGLAGPVVRDVSVPETITVAELAHKMSVKATEVIKALMKLGQMVTINQMLDQETAMIVVEEMGHKAQAAKLDDPGFAAGGIARRIGGRIAAAAAGGDGDGSRRSRQDVVARHDPPHARGERRSGRHHAAHRRVPRRNREGRHHVPRHARPRSLHGDARARRQGHRHGGPGRRCRRRRDAADQGSDRACQGGERAAGGRDQQDGQARSQHRARQAGTRGGKRAAGRIRRRRAVHSGVGEDRRRHRPLARRPAAAGRSARAQGGEGRAGQGHRDRSAPRQGPRSGGDGARPVRDAEARRHRARRRGVRPRARDDRRERQDDHRAPVPPFRWKSRACPMSRSPAKT